jgi:hypothetical protein
VYADELQGAPADAESLGDTLAARLLDAGARPLLAELRAASRS